MHFEDIWNEAEEVSDKFPEETLEKNKILDRMRTVIDLLDRDNVYPDETTLIGELLFEVATYCASAYKREVNINVANILKAITLLKKKQLLEPEK